MRNWHAERRKAQPPKPPRPEPDHGTTARYRRGCRCDGCHAAFLEDQKAKRHRARDKKLATLAESHPHGGAVLFRAGCRCDACRTGSAERRTTRNQRLRENGPHGERKTYLAGCRCQPCRAADREYIRQWRANWADRLDQIERHGTGAAIAMGCRCGACRKYLSNYHKDLRRRRRSEGRPIDNRESLHRYRARKRANFVEDVDPQYIFERDNWRCHLRITKGCKRVGGRVDPTKKFPHDRYPTIDHVTPNALDGTHERANIKTACLQCNCKKGAKPLGQPMIPGLA